jgi:hypothetical protein
MQGLGFSKSNHVSANQAPCVHPLSPEAVVASMLKFCQCRCRHRCIIIIAFNNDAVYRLNLLLAEGQPDQWQDRSAGAFRPALTRQLVPSVRCRLSMPMHTLHTCIHTYIPTYIHACTKTAHTVAYVRAKASHIKVVAHCGTTCKSLPAP